MALSVRVLSTSTTGCYVCWVDVCGTKCLGKQRVHVDGYQLLNTKVPDRRGRPSFDRPLFTYLQPEVYPDSSTFGPLTVRNSGTRSAAELRDEIRRSCSAVEVSKIFL